MKLLTCHTMREGAVLAGALLLTGAALILSVTSQILPDVAAVPLIANVLGIITLLLAPVVLIITFFLSVRPGSRKKLDQYNH